MQRVEKKRLRQSLFASSCIIGIGIYDLFIQMGTYFFVPLVIGIVMLAGSLAMRVENKEKTGGAFIVFSVLLLFFVANNMINTMVSTYSIDLGSEDLNFSIIDRLLNITCFVLGGTYGLIAGMDGILGTGFFLKMLEKHHVPKITMLLNASLTSFTLLWIAFYLTIARHPIESLVYFPMAIGAVAVFFVGWWAINRHKSIGIVMLGNFLCALLFGFLSVLDFIYLPLCMLNILSNEALLTRTGKEVTFWPRFKNKRNRIFEISAIPICIVSIAIVPLPFVVQEWPATTITIPAGQEQDVLEINWAIGSEQRKDFDWYIQNDTLAALTYINNNISSINISVTIPLVREIFNSSISDIMKALYAANITFDLMPIVDSSQFGFSDEYIHDESIHRFKNIYREMREWLIHDGVINSSLPGGKMYRAIVVDLERTQQIAGSIVGLVMNYMSGPAGHVLGSNELIDLVEEFKRNGENVAAAFFDFHIYDFVDLDDAQQEFFKISIVPPTDWDYIASMVYQNGPGSNLSVHAYANDMNYHFGDKSVPYVVTMDSDYEDILTRFRILKNTGFSKVGAWALHELFFEGNDNGNHSDDLFGVDQPHRDAGGNPDTWNFSRLIQLHEDLAKDVDVTYTFDRFSSQNMYYSLSMLLDAWLIRRAIYWSWPIMGERLPNPQFTTNTALCIATYVVLGFLAFYIAWNPYGRRRKKSGSGNPALSGKEQPAPVNTAA